MKQRTLLPVLLVAALAGGCAELGSLGGTKYGESGTTAATQSERDGTITRLENIKVDDDYKLGVGTAVGAVAGGLLGAGVGDSKTATVVGAAVGAVAGTYAESKLVKKDAQRITVRMATGGTVTITQPVDARLSEGMKVRVEGSGESARVVPASTRGLRVRAPGLHGAPEQPLEFRERPGVQHVVLFQPAAPRLAHAVAQIGEVEAAVRVGVDADQHAFLPGGEAVAVEQVEALGMGVEFEKAAAVFCMADDAQHVDVVGLAFVDEPAAGMRQDREVGMVHRAQDALGLFRP